MPVLFHALPSVDVRKLQAGQPDYYGQIPKQTESDGAGTPCRHCLANTPEGKTMLILSYRPFQEDQPYAEVGPIFLCGDNCKRFADSGDLPPILRTSPDYLIKGYGIDDRIVYGTGQIIAPDNMVNSCESIFEDPDVSYIHVRSARNNCYQCKVTRAA